MNLGGPEIIVILIVALLVFGPNRLPEIGKQLGKALREFRKVEARVKTEISSALDLDSHDAKVDDQSLAPHYGDPTNVPDQPEPISEVAVSREVPTTVDDHDAPPPIVIEPDPAPESSADAGTDNAGTEQRSGDARRPGVPPAS